jgi:hypothetical protein
MPSKKTACMGDKAKLSGAGGAPTALLFEVIEIRLKV